MISNLLKKWFSRSSASKGTPSASGVADSCSGATTGDFSEVWLYPDSKSLQKQTLLKARRIEQPVFQIGRRISDAVHYNHDNPPDLLIVENAPYTLSRLQCEIIIENDNVILRDLGSRVGTALGKKRLRSSSRKPTSVVVPRGTHKLILGHRNGPFHFRLEVK